ncbi:MAG: DUF308 domain-containing protein [Marinobacter sp.]|uniref:HdeD family acid-resistance protein n=1 Tax=Marinobacter sp. TaxID=50741 RepID=UPI00299D5BBC|nr:DUF308 domain-containing protein [Marinobacter sp.]MDX1635748.1 DUF308 domain-containing protein [Marinobacter sp.]
MSMHTTRYEIHIEDRLVRDIREHRGWFTGLGLLFLVLGVAAIAFPWVAALSLELAIGALLLIGGIAQMVQTLRGPRWSGYGMSLTLAGVALIAGLLMLVFPVAGVFTLATVVMLFLLIGGTLKTAFALLVRPAVGWGWILTSGLLSLALGLLILAQFTATVPWVLGLLLGVDFIFTGIWMLMLASHAGRLG